MAVDKNGKPLPKGITYRAAENRYMGRLMIDGISYTLYDKKWQDLETKMNDLRYEVTHGIYCKPKDETISSWFSIWMEQYKAIAVKEATKQTYQQVFESFIEPVIGRKKLCDIRPQALQKLINDLYHKQYSKSRVNITYVILLGMFEQALKNEIIQRNPMEAVSFPKYKKKSQDDKRVMTQEEKELFLKYAASSKYYDFYVIALTTGMRINEILALEWSDIDFKEGFIHVTGTLVYVRKGAGRYKDTPKTASSQREIPMLNNVSSLLKERRKRQLELKVQLGDKWKTEKGLENMVMTYDEGGVYWDTGIRVDMKKIIQNIQNDGFEFAPSTLWQRRTGWIYRC